MTTTNSLPTNHVEFVNMLHACIDLSEREPGDTLLSIIKAETNRYELSVSVVESWLRGLPSTCSIPFWDNEVMEICVSSGKGELSADEYWAECAKWVLAFAMTPELFPLAEPVKPSIQWTRIKNDSNGNPRYVCHFLNLNTREELDKSGDEWIPVSEKYALALARAKKIGGKRFHNKQYGGGIVFQCYGPSDIEPHIERILKEGN